MKVENIFFVGFRDINFLNELTNTSILAFLENMAGMHSELVGNGINKKTSWILLGWKVRMFKRPKFADKVIVQTWSREMEKIYAYRDFNIFNEQGDLIGIATSKWAYIDIEKGRIIRISSEVEELYQSEKIFTFSEEESYLKKIVEPSNYISYIEFNITRNMIDTNQHLHNIYYLDIAKQALPEEIYFKNELNNFEIMYKKEIKCNDKVKAFYSFENEKHIVTIKNMEETDVHAIIVLN